VSQADARHFPLFNQALDLASGETFALYLKFRSFRDRYDLGRQFSEELELIACVGHGGRLRLLM